MGAELRSLLSPLRVGPVELPNRVVFLPHLTLYGNDDHTPSDRHRAYYEARARGGVGLIVTEGQSVHPTGSMLRAVAAYDATKAAGWTPTVEAVHRHGTKLFAQLAHYGNQTFTEFTEREAWAPSAVPDPAVGHVPKAMTLDDVAELVEGFATAARNLVAVGFDGVELKVAHDGVLRQFLSPHTNRRDDAYGGDVDRRLRIVLECVDAVREAVGDGAAVGVRLCLDEGFPGGYVIADGLEYARRIDAHGGVDYLSSDLGTWQAPETISPSPALPPGYALEAVRALTGAVSVPVIAFGRITTAAQADEIVASGTAELVGMARALIADPDLVAKSRDGRAVRVRPCVACNQICNGRLFRFQPIGCVHNPAAGREAELAPVEAVAPPDRRHVLVVGGGPTGLKAAEVAARRGHRVTLVERGDRLGGQVRLAASAPGHTEWGRIVEHLEGELVELGVDVRCGTDATDELVERLDPDAVVDATGAGPGPWPFAVTGDATVVDEWSLFGGDSPSGRRVVLFDLGVQFEGVAVAETLADRGKQVVWVAPTPMMGMGVEMATLAPARRRLAEHGVELRPEHVVAAVDGGTVTLVDVMTGDSTRVDDVDAVVVAGNKVTRCGPEVGGSRERHAGGDAVAPRSVEMAILDGERIGRAL
jgi:2,4-dienoyl-CoA reductase (NADPH2)